jgi:hypothetical protein
MELERLEQLAVVEEVQLVVRHNAVPSHSVAEASEAPN